MTRKLVPVLSEAEYRRLQNSPDNPYKQLVKTGKPWRSPLTLWALLTGAGHSRKFPITPKEQTKETQDATV